MNQSQRTAAADASNMPSAPSGSMPNVLFREIHKNAFLKRHSSDRRTGFPRKSERVWVVFCVHDDVEPFLEIYPDQKVALTHKPEWFASLSNALHVSPTICGQEDEFEFAVTLSFQVVRLAAPSWESMMEWVETIRNKLRELKVLCPKENVYSKMPEQKQPLLPTRDPNSPLPLPPEGPSTLFPGVELVHVQSRNGSSSHDNGDIVRHQRDAQTGNNGMHLRQIIKKKMNERDKRSAMESSQPTESPISSTNNTSENVQELNGEEVGQVLLNSSFDLQKKKPRVNRAASVPQATPSTSQITLGPNVTVIEVSTAGNRKNHSASEFNSNDCVSDSDDADDVFYNASVSQKSVIKNGEMNSSEEEGHYEHVFLSSVPINKSHQSQGLNCNSRLSEDPAHIITKPHSTSLLINSDNSTTVISPIVTVDGDSPNESLPSTSCPIVEVQKSVSSCPSRIPTTDATDSISPVHEEIQTKLESVNISGLIPRVSGKSSRQGISKSSNFSKAKESNPNVADSRKCSIESQSAQSRFCSEERDLGRVEIAENGETNPPGPSYSQVRKVAKVKSNSVKSNSPVFPKKKSSEIQVVEEQPEIGHRFEMASALGKNPICLPKPSNKVGLQQRGGIGSKNLGVVVVNSVCKERNQSSSNVSSGDGEHRPEVVAPAGQRADNASAKDSQNGCNGNAEVEPMPATVQPAVGVITVEDIPLIGGHQRRRRRSSSSDPTPILGNPSSRGIGGADRIRINVAQASILAGREEQARGGETETRSSGSRNINVAPQSSRLTLREQQVLQLKKEMLHPGGVRLQLRRKDCTGSIAFVDAINGVWVAGWKQKEHPLLYNALHIGDQLVSVGDVPVRNSAEAQKLIRNSTGPHVEFIIRRTPLGNVFALQRSSEEQNLGIVREGNTAEIRDVIANGPAARQGLTPKTLSQDGSSLTNWFLTEINGRPLNLFFKDNEVRDRLNAVGKEISILVQPHDFIKQIKKQLKSIRGYKDYIVQ